MEILASKDQLNQEQQKEVEELEDKISLALLEISSLPSVISHVDGQDDSDAGEAFYDALEDLSLGQNDVTRVLLDPSHQDLLMQLSAVVDSISLDIGKSIYRDSRYI